MTLSRLHFFSVSLHDRREPVALSAACQMTVNSHLSCQEAPMRQVLQDGTHQVSTHPERRWKWNFTISNCPLCCFSCINIENNSSVSWAEFIHEGKCGNVSLIKCWHVEDSISFTTIKISSRKALTRPYSTLLRSVTHVSVFPLGVVIIRVSIRGALFTHPCFWLRVKEGAAIFHPEHHDLSSV